MIPTPACAREARDSGSDRIDAIKVELKSIPRQREAALREEARTGKPADAKLDDRERDLRADLEREAAARDAANRAAKVAQRELVVLHHDQFGGFAESAEELTEAAAAKLVAIREGYQAIEQARAEWSLISSDYNRILADRIPHAEKVKGELRRRRLSPPPPNSLPPPGQVFGPPPIRPPEVESLGRLTPRVSAASSFRTR